MIRRGERWCNRPDASRDSVSSASELSTESSLGGKQELNWRKQSPPPVRLARTRKRSSFYPAGDTKDGFPAPRLNLRGAGPFCLSVVKDKSCGGNGINLGCRSRR